MHVAMLEAGNQAPDMSSNLLQRFGAGNKASGAATSAGSLLVDGSRNNHVGLHIPYKLYDFGDAGNVLSFELSDLCR